MVEGDRRLVPPRLRWLVLVLLALHLLVAATPLRRRGRVLTRLVRVGPLVGLPLVGPAGHLDCLAVEHRDVGEVVPRRPLLLFLFSIVPFTLGWPRRGGKVSIKR